MLDDFDSVIAEKKSSASRKRAQAAELIREAERLEAVLEGMEEARRYFGGGRKPSTTTVAGTPGRREKTSGGGRQPGAISRRWVEVYRHIWESAGGHFDIPLLGETIAKLEDREIRPAEARRQVETHAEHGLIVQVFDLTDTTPRYLVTDLTAEKYSFGSRSKSNHEAAGNGLTSNENGEPEGSPDNDEDHNSSPHSNAPASAFE
ncbi:MAG TPA: hypothetical protein ENH89_01180 [Aurantimonas coralicida]|nr:hypothetical protein [Aurantimonas coralicida]